MEFERPSGGAVTDRFGLVVGRRGAKHIEYGSGDFFAGRSGGRKWTVCTGVEDRVFGV